MGGQDCIFCKVIRRQIPAKIVFENEHLLAFDDIHPQAPIHVLIIPKEHVESINQFTDRHFAVLGEMAKVARDLVRKDNTDRMGYRLVVNTERDAGQSVFHIHMHLLGGRAMAWPPG